MLGEWTRADHRVKCRQEQGLLHQNKGKQYFQLLVTSSPYIFRMWQKYSFWTFWLIFSECISSLTPPCLWIQVNTFCRINLAPFKAICAVVVLCVEIEIKIKLSFVIFNRFVTRKSITEQLINEKVINNSLLCILVFVLNIYFSSKINGWYYVKCKFNSLLFGVCMIAKCMNLSLDLNPPSLATIWRHIWFICLRCWQESESEEVMLITIK